MYRSVQWICGVAVPKNYAWDSGTNAIGAEYMIMEKVCRSLFPFTIFISIRFLQGSSPLYSMWSILSLLDKKIIIRVARYLFAAFQARFDQAGFLYLSRSTDTPNPFPLVHPLRLRMGFRCILTNAWLRALRNFEARSAHQENPKKT